MGSWNVFSIEEVEVGFWFAPDVKAGTKVDFHGGVVVRGTPGEGYNASVNIRRLLELYHVLQALLTPP
jgi:hypothetical protein